MKQLKLGDWVIPEVPGGIPAIGTEYSRTILGDSYTTVVLPDGKEWMGANLAAPSLGGAWYLDGLANDGDGRYYTGPGIEAASFPDGWRIPTEQDMEDLGAVLVLDDAAPLCRVGRWWTSGAEHASDAFGFGLSPTGGKDPVWGWGGKIPPPGLPAPGEQAWLWYLRSGAPARWGVYIGSTPERLVWYTENYPDASGFSLPVRLVRDAVPLPPTPAIYGYHDILLDDTGSAILVEDLAQRVDCRLRTFMGEHWLNPEIGVPWFEEFLGQKNPNLSVCRSLLLTVIQGVPGVTAVTSLDLGFAKNSNSRVLEVRFTVTGTDSLPVSGTTAVTA